jgi:hypothetical protein
MKWEADVKQDLKLITFTTGTNKLQVGMNWNGSLIRPKLIKSCSTDRILSFFLLFLLCFSLHVFSPWCFFLSWTSFNTNRFKFQYFPYYIWCSKYVSFCSEFIECFLCIPPKCSLNLVLSFRLQALSHVSCVTLVKASSSLLRRKLLCHV